MDQHVNFEGKTVLLVEDELFLAEKIGHQLSDLGIREVLSAVSLSEAVQHIENEHIDIALLDVNLEEGQTTISLGRDLSRDQVAVVFFSGISSVDMVDMSRGFEFIEKPLSLPRLKAAMQRAIVRSRALVSGRSQTKMAGHEARQ